ncbi:dual specificity mitogen-activated protein kinase kinase 7-like [Oscarella lobularis]|uniref:dual specificity mitogen-activated protein kinase kinase 7-like n=1 Tax=Oscarella lobularis TaxID=121494 RepID=UPI003313EF32
MSDPTLDLKALRKKTQRLSFELGSLSLSPGASPSSVASPSSAPVSPSTRRPLQPLLIPKFGSPVASRKHSAQTRGIPGLLRRSPTPQSYVGSAGSSAASSETESPADTTRVDGVTVDPQIERMLKTTGVLKIYAKEYPGNEKDLQMVSRIGHGTSGQVAKMKHVPSGMIMAVKTMNRSHDREEQKRVLMDLFVMTTHLCPYIVTCYGCIITDDEVYICMELMGCCVDKLMKKTGKAIPEDIIGKISVSVIKALNYLKEKHNIIHRDIKPSNILLDSAGNVKLCDFGISGRLVDSKAKTRAAGSAAYMAPERIAPDTAQLGYDIRADIWSFGITMVEMATGSFPYKDCKKEFDVLTKIMMDPSPQIPRDKKFSINFQDFVSQCLIKDLEKRPRYKQLLEHPFIKWFEVKHVNVSQWYSTLPSFD